MAKDFLSGFGPERTEGAKRASCGGCETAKELPYNPPLGPKHQTNERPGLGGGTNHGNAGTQGKH